MKFITSRIVSPSQTLSLMEIIADKKSSKKQAPMEKGASADKATVKVAAVEKPAAKVAAVKEPTIKASAPKKVKEKVQELEIKKVVAHKSIPKRIFKKVAKLSNKDNSFLKEYFSRYYPSDYVEALLANY